MALIAHTKAVRIVRQHKNSFGVHTAPVIKMAGIQRKKQDIRQINNVNLPTAALTSPTQGCALNVTSWGGSCEHKEGVVYYLLFIFSLCI